MTADRRALPAGLARALLILSLAAAHLAGCAAEDAALEARLCAVQEDCPPGRSCVDGACVLSEVEREQTLCQGSELRTVRVICDDYLCDSPRIELLDRVDCTEPPPASCDGDRRITQGGGSCDAALARCVYPPPDVTDCLATRIRCDGDARVVEQGIGCDPETARCAVDTAREDCRATIDALPSSCESGRYLSRATLGPDVAACDPLTVACRSPDVERVDCLADRIGCDGNALVVQRNGSCLDGACQYMAESEVDCAAPPPGQCDGDLLITRGRGGICDPSIAACRYPEPAVEDCGREQTSCDGDTSEIRPAGACLDGACTVEASRVDCTAEAPIECVDAPALGRRFHPGGICDRTTGRCAYPEPVVEACPTRYECVGSSSRRFLPLACDSGQCIFDIAERPCAAPAGYCDEGVAYNYTRGAGCEAATGRCIGPDVAADTAEPCADELFCQGNVLFGPGDPNCAVQDGVAGCVALPLLDCNRAPAPTCQGSRRVDHIGPGVCDAVAGCRFGEADVTDCAACLPAGAVCVLPGTVRLPESAVDMGPADASLPAALGAPLVMTTTEITRAEVAELTGQGLLRPLLGAAPAGCDDGRCPATGLSWIDAVAIANARSARDGLTPCYDPAGRVAGGDGGDPYLCEGWRLPTEAEWLAAWRAGTATRWPCGDDPTCLDGMAVAARLDAEGPRPVGQGPANAAGLYDLGGNAREWVHDAFGPLTGGRDPYGPSDGAQRVLRGGSWRTTADAAEVTAREGRDAHQPVEDAGVRLVRGLAPRPAASCQVDPITEQAFARVVQRRGTCALTPGVPCAYEYASVRCPFGCRAGVCLGEGDLEIVDVQVPGVDPGDIVVPGGPGDPGGEGPDGGRGLAMPIEFAAIPAGAFTHGTGPAARRTTIAHDFWLMTTEMAYLQFRHLYEEGDLERVDFPRVYMRSLILEQLVDCRDGLASCLTLPVFGVTWLDAVRIANNLSISEGLAPCYDHDGRVVDGVDGDPQTCIGYRLPTEAEWVYAARSGATTTWSCGDDALCLAQDTVFAATSATRIDDPADCPCRGDACPLWTAEGHCRFPGPIDGTSPGDWGLVGMSGNVAEWVSDHGDGSGPAVGGRDPYRGPADGRRPVLKGGAWYEESNALRLDARALPDGSVFPAVAAGVRLARTVIPAEMPIARINGPRTVGDLTVTGDFEITTHEITRATAVELGAADGSAFSACGDDCSINRIGRLEAIAVANALSRRHGLQPCYTADGEVRASAFDDPYRCEGWRLPTEAEWRVLAPCDADCVAASGRTLCTSGYPDEVAGEDDPTAWCSCDEAYFAAGIEPCGFPRDALPHPACEASPICLGPHPVGSRPADLDGLYDRAGNLREWVHDRWTDVEPTGIDPYGPPDEGPVLCAGRFRDCFTAVGGSWGEPPVPVDHRRAQTQGDDQTGFRLVRSLDPGAGAAP